MLRIPRLFFIVKGDTLMSVRTSLAALAIAGLSLAGGATAAAGVLAAPPAAAVLTSTVAPPA